MDDLEDMLSGGNVGINNKAANNNRFGGNIARNTKPANGLDDLDDLEDMLDGLGNNRSNPPQKPIKPKQIIPQTSDDEIDDERGVHEIVRRSGERTYRTRLKTKEDMEP